MIFNRSGRIGGDEEIPPFLTTTTFPSVFADSFTRGFKQKDLTTIDRIVDSFMRQYKVPGMSIAITHRGRLVYAKGFGFVRKLTRLERWKRFLTEQGIPEGLEVNPWHLFRIASVSKPITAVAIMMLVEQGRLMLADRVFGNGALLDNDFGFGNLPPDYQNTQRLSQITVQHLLEHTSGGWPNDGADPMFIKPEIDQSQLITWVLENRGLNRDPGSVHSYSNFGFCLLGRIIEKVTGQTYSDYVKDNVLKRCGIRNMHIAGNSLSDRRSDEVIYYGQPYSVMIKAGGVPFSIKQTDNPYSFNVARMDSHGGWLASPVDLVRFAVHVDGFPTKPDILNSNSIKTMTEKTTAREVGGGTSNYAKGWSVYIDPDENNWFHFGNLPGTLSLLVRGGNGFCWSALANTYSWTGYMKTDLDEQVMWKIINTVSKWPDHDLFSFYDDPWQLLKPFDPNVVAKP